MFQVVLSSNSSKITLSIKPVENTNQEDILSSDRFDELTTEQVVISVDGKNYEVPREDFNAAVQPFLYRDRQDKGCLGV